MGDEQQGRPARVGVSWVEETRWRVDQSITFVLRATWAREDGRRVLQQASARYEHHVPAGLE